MDSLQVAQMILAWGAFTALGFSARLFPVLVFIGLAIFVGSVIGYSIAANAVGSMLILLKDVLEFLWTVSTQNLVTVVAALVGFVGGASFKRGVK